MNVKINENALNGGTLQLATKQLEEVVGKSAATVTAEWERARDENGRDLYKLKLSDYTGNVSANFAPNELTSVKQLRSRIRELWGDLLQIRSHKQLDKIMGNGDGETGNGAQV